MEGQSNENGSRGTFFCGKHWCHADFMVGFHPQFWDFTSSVTDFFCAAGFQDQNWNHQTLGFFPIKNRDPTGIQPSTWNRPVEGRFAFGSSSPSQGLNFWGFRKPTESSPSTNQSRPGFEPTGMGQKLSAFVKRWILSGFRGHFTTKSRTGTNYFLTICHMYIP